MNEERLLARKIKTTGLKKRKKGIVNGRGK